MSFINSSPSNAPLPAVAGAKLVSAGGAGHFIALWGRPNDLLIIADPIDGRQTVLLQQLAVKYEFTGFLLVIKPRPE